MARSVRCVIFDLDGTLVDSEALCNQALLDVLPQLGAPVRELVGRYRGRRLAWILEDLRRRLGMLPETIESDYRRRVEILFAERLRPVEGVPAMLERLPWPCCVASNGPPAKIDAALAHAGLEHRFPAHRRFSAYAVASWKPDPGLFLHAAAAMGAVPAQCVVVEDSDAGMAAAQAAGMPALQYLPDAAAQAYGGAPRFASMERLPALLDQVACRL